MKSEIKCSRIRILIVDDHLIVRAGLTTLLGKEEKLLVAGAVGSGSEAISFLERNEVDVVLLDLRMQGAGGIEVLPAIRSGKNSPSVLILSSYDYDEEIYQAAKAGASGYLTKDVARAEIIQAIEDIAAGRSHFPRSIAERLAQRESRIGL